MDGGGGVRTGCRDVSEVMRDCWVIDESGGGSHVGGVRGAI